MDPSGMTVMHFAAKFTHPEWTGMISEKHADLANRKTYAGKVLDEWLPMIFLAEQNTNKPHKHRQVAVMLAQMMDAGAMLTLTGKKSNAIHQMVSRGHVNTLLPLLQVYHTRLGTQALSQLLNLKLGKDELGTVDIAL